MLAVLAASCLAPTAWAGPTGGQVVGGQAVIQTLNQETLIKQSTRRAIINWNTFSIQKNESVVFEQPNARSIALNRILGGSPSAIFGKLTANGQVWLVNPNGILFGRNATVNAAGVLATTANIANSDFMSGRYNFGTPSSNPNAEIANYGTIDTPGGATVLAAPIVDNSGTIEARLGTVAIGTGSTFAVDFDGDNLLSFAVKTPAAGGKIENAGKLAADGGTVELTARAVGNIVDNVINTSGIVQANSVSIKGGTVILDGGQGGSVNVTGSVNAVGSAAGTTGGTVKVLGTNVALGPTASVNVSGAAGGGTADIGGDFHGAGHDANATITSIAAGATITADALTRGNGGHIAVWSNQSTSFNGSISAQGGAQGGNGGFVETSSAADLSIGTGTVNTRAIKGLIGSWLLDPENITIVSSGGGATLTGASSYGNDPGQTDDINASVIDGATANVILQAKNTIDFAAPVAITTAGVSLTAQADSIIVGNTIATNGGAIALTANAPGSNQSGNGTLQLNAGLSSAGGDIMLGGPTLVGASIALDSVTGANNGGGGITFAGTLDDSAAYAHNLSIMAGGGDVNFEGRVGFNDPASGGTAAGTPLGAVTITANNINLDMPYDAPNGNGFDVGSLTVTAAGSFDATQSYISTYNLTGNGGAVQIAAGGGVNIFGGLNTGSGSNGGNGGAVDITAGGSVSIGACCTVATFGTRGTGDEQVPNQIGVFTVGFSPTATGQTAGNAGSVTITGSSINLPLGLDASGGNALIDGSTANGGNAGTVMLTATAGNVALGDPINNGNLQGMLVRGGDSIGGTGGNGGNVSITASNQISFSRIETEGGSTAAASGAGSGGDVTLIANATIGPAVIMYGEAESAQASFTALGTIEAFAGDNGVTFGGTGNFFHTGGTIGNTGGNIKIGSSTGALKGSSFVQLVNDVAAAASEGGATIYIGTDGTAIGANAASISINGPIEGTTPGAEALRIRDLGAGGVLGPVTVSGGIGDQIALGYVSLSGGTVDLSGNITTKPGNLPDYQLCSGSPYACGTDPATYAGDVFFNGAVTLDGNVVINTAGGDPFGSPGGSIVFGNVDASPVNGAFALSLETGGSGSPGTVSFDAGSDVGMTTALTELLIRSGTDIGLQNVITSGSQYYVTGGNDGTVTLNGSTLTAGSGVTPGAGMPGSDIQFLGNVQNNATNLVVTTNGTISGGEIYASGLPQGNQGVILNAGQGLIVAGGMILPNPTGTTGPVTRTGCPPGLTCYEGPTQELSGDVLTDSLNQGAHILLTGDTTFESNGAVTITPTIDSADGNLYNVTVQQGNVQTLFRQAEQADNGIVVAGTIGDARTLGSLTITGVSGSVSLGSVGSPVVPGLNQGMLWISNLPTSLGGIISTRDGEVDINGPVTLTGNLTIDTTVFDSGTGAPINFGTTIDDSALGQHSLSLNAGNSTIALDGNIGDAMPVGAVSIVAHGSSEEGCQASLCLFGDITTQNGKIAIDAPTYLDADVTLSTIGTTAHRGAGADIVLSSNTTVDADPSAEVSTPSFAVDAGTGAITIGAALGTNDALGNVTLTSSSRINLGGNIATAGSTGEGATGAVTINGPMVLSNPVTVDTTNGGVTGGSNIAFNGTVDDSSTGNQWLILKANDTPQADLDHPGACCDGSDQATPSTNGGKITLADDLGGNVALGEVELTGSQIALGGNITTSGGQISVFAGIPDNGAAPGLVLTKDGVTTLSTGTGPVNLFYANNIDGTNPGQQGLTIDSTPTVVLPPAVGANVALGALTVPGPVELHGSITTAGGAIDLGAGGTVFLTSTLDTTADGAVPAGADITIGGPLASGNPTVNLTLNGGSGGVVTLGGNVGTAGDPFTSLDVTGATLDLGGNITTNGGGLAVNIGAATVLENSVTINTAAGNGNILLGQTDAASAGAQGLTLIAGTGDVDLGNGGPVGGTTALGAVTLTSSNVQIFNGIITQNGAITINGGATPIFNSATFDTTAGGAVAGANITVNGTIDENCCVGQHALAFDAGTATAIFNGAIGGQLAPDSLMVTAGTISFKAGVKTVGTLTLDGGAGLITAKGAIDVGAFILQGGNWSQIAASLPAFTATDFELQGGTFVRALGGSGSPGAPYQIGDVYGLQGIGTLLDDSFVLARNIAAGGASGWNGGGGFMPIGADSAFAGSLDGQNHTITGLAIDSGAGAVGLFGTNGGSVSNVKLVDATVASSGSNAAAGSLAGINSGTIGNSSATGSVTGTSENGGEAMLGGLVGYNNGGTINGGSFAKVAVTDNVNYGDDFLGGLVGRSNGTISQTYATGTVTGTGHGVENGWGGLVGALDGGTIDQSFALGEVFNNSSDVPNVGGLVGKQNGGAITNSYASGAVISQDAEGGIYIGGLVGWQTGGSIATSYSVGLVQCPNNGCSQGGLIGVGNGAVDALSFWNIDSSGQSTSGSVCNCFAGTGLTTSQAQSPAFLENMNGGNGWSFSGSSPWRIANGSYPFLLWFGSATPVSEIISGVAPDGSTVDLIINGTNISSTTAAGNGAYQFLLTSGTTGVALVYVQGGTTDAVSALTASGAAGLTLTNANTVYLTGQGGTVATSNLATARGSNNNPNILYGVNGTTIQLSNGTALIVAGGAGGVLVDDAVVTAGGGAVTINGASIALAANITTGGGTISLNGPMSLTGAAPVLTLDTTGHGQNGSGADIGLNGTVDAQNGQGLTVNGGTGGTVTIGGLVGGNSPSGFGPVAISASSIDLNANIDTAGQPITLDGQLVFAGDVTVGTTANNHPQGANITLNGVLQSIADIDPTLTLDGGTGGAVNGSLNLGTGFFLALSAGSSNLNGTVNGAGGNTAAQYVTVNSCGVCTFNGVNDGITPPPPPPPPPPPQPPQQIIGQANPPPSQLPPEPTSQPTTQPTPVVPPSSYPTQEASYDPNEANAPTTVSGLDSGASLFGTISPTSSTDLTVNQGVDAIVVAYANPAPVKPAANAEAQRPPVVNPVGAYLNRMVNPTMPSSGVPGIAFGYSLSGNSALW